MTKAAEPIALTIPLRKQVTCPHCWESFPTDAILWIAEHPDLVGDERLGPKAPRRFLPTRFNVAGAALDAKGVPCHGLACSHCHLPVPRALLEVESFFTSVLGGPGCGKSYFLASMTWRLRAELSKRFALSFTDVDAQFNRRLSGYESRQFVNNNVDALVTIEKTETAGDFYSTVQFEDRVVDYLQPFVFLTAPLPGHPSANATNVAKVICLYDNAGESFLPGMDNANRPVTRHLAQSRAMMFLFDPTQDPRFRSACRGKSSDPQMRERTEGPLREQTVRQETILTEAANRVRKLTSLSHHARHGRPLLVIVTKFDAWSALLGGGRLPDPWKVNPVSGLTAVDRPLVDDVSRQVRALLLQHAPEVVPAAESFASEVVYIPISATGCSPEVDPRSGAQGFRPRNLQPMWAEVPMLYTMSRWMKGLVLYTRHATNGEAATHGHASAAPAHVATDDLPTPHAESPSSHAGGAE